MSSSNSNFAMIIGHPGHELRVFRFVELYKPRVYVLTDGSGVTGTGRINSTIKILEQCGASVSPVMGCFSDKEMYRIILENDVTPLLKLSQTIQADFAENNIDAVMGDAIEGFNPTHDLCRYLINSIVQSVEKNTGKRLLNFDFLLDGIMNGNSNCPSGRSLPLTDEDFERKITAAAAYNELAYELKHAVEKYGKSAFKTEYIRQVLPPYMAAPWEDDVPFYEKYAREKVNTGKYQQVITYQNHLLPLLSRLEALT
jgi:hypothetical protein